MSKNKKELSPEAQEILDALINMTNQADEDCPAVYRTEHFDEALEEANEVIKKYNGKR